MKNYKIKYSPAKRLTDEDILFLAAEDTGDSNENKDDDKIANARDNRQINKSINTTKSNKRRPGRPPKKETDDNKNVPSQQNADQQPKRKPGRPPFKATDDNKNIPSQINADQQTKRRPGRPPLKATDDNKNIPLQQSSEQQTKRKPGRPPLKATDDNKNIPSQQSSEQQTKRKPGRPPFKASGDNKNIPSQQSSEQQPKRRPGRPPKIQKEESFFDGSTHEKASDSESAIARKRRSGLIVIDEAKPQDLELQRIGETEQEIELIQETDTAPEEKKVSISEKVKRAKKRGRRSKKNPLIVVVSKEEKPKVSETEKVEEISSIKSVFSSTFNKEEEKPKPKQPIKIEPLTDIYNISSEKQLKSDDKKNDFMVDFLNEVERFLVREMYVDRDSKLLVAVSGGVDSMVLLDILAVLADKYKFALFIAHYNHDLRGEQSEKDLEFVKKAVEAYNLPFYSAVGKVRQYAEKNATSIETAARFLRYSFLERTSRNLNVDFVATAHTSDDSAETFMINLLRGSGLTGLSGIPFRRQFIKDVLLIRPLINFKKNTLIKYAKLRNIKWREDETNILQNYTRNRVRHDLLPKLAKDYNPAIIDVINRTSKLLQGADRIIHGYVRNNLTNVLTDIQTDKFTIKLPIFQTFDRFIQGEMIQTALMKYFRAQLPSLKAIDRVIALQDSEIGAKCEINKTIIALRDRNAIVFSKKQFIKDVDTVIDRVGKFKVANVTLVLKEVTREQYEQNKNQMVEFFDYDSIPPAIFIRTWQEGDIFQPLGMSGRIKISDFLTNEKVAFVDRQNVLVMATKTDIIWVLGKRISEKFKVTLETERILKVELRYSEK